MTARRLKSDFATGSFLTNQMRKIKILRIISAIAFSLGFFAHSDLAYAETDVLANKYFLDTNLPTHADGMQRFEPSNFLALGGMNAFDMIQIIIELNKIDAESALVMWNGDFFKNDEELSDEILKNTQANEIKFVEIFDGEGDKTQEKTNKIINLITKVYSVKTDDEKTVAINPVQKSKPIENRTVFNSKLEFDSQKYSDKAKIATNFDEQGKLENAQVNFGETYSKQLATSLFANQEFFGKDFFLEAKFKKKETSRIERKTAIIGTGDQDSALEKTGEEEILALNSTLKSNFLGYNTIASFSSMASLTSENSDQFYDNGTERGVYETYGATLQFEKENTIISAGAETKALSETQSQSSNAELEVRLVQSRAFAKMVKVWDLIDNLALSSEIGGALYNIESPFAMDEKGNIFALTSRIIATYENPEAGKISAKFEMVPGEYYRNNVGFVFPMSGNLANDFAPQSSQNLELNYDKSLGTIGNLRLVYESRNIQNQIRSIQIFGDDNTSNWANGDFGNAYYQKIGANYDVTLPFIPNGKINSDIRFESENSPKAFADNQTLYGLTKKQNYKVDFSANLGNSKNIWGASFEKNAWQYYGINNSDIKMSKAANLGVFMNFDYGKSGAIRAEVNSAINSNNKTTFSDKNGNIYSPLDFSNTDKPKIRLIYMKKM